MAIAAKVRQCLVAFKTLCDIARGSALESMSEERGRFTVWAGNISAHRTESSRRSLEYRLRDASSLRNTLLSLLQDLSQALEQIRGTLVSASPGGPQAAVSIDEVFVDEDGSSEINVDLEEAEDQTSEEEQLIEEVHDVVNCLMRFSMALRNPAKHDQVRQSVSTVVQYEPYDVDHVRSKYRDAPEYLVRRLGKAISKHRQYFTYREQHHAKLAEGLDEEQDEGEIGRPSTVATSLQQQQSAPTVPTVLDDFSSDSETVFTATSFASSASSASGRRSLRPPPLPTDGVDGDPFQCPICFAMIVATNERAWRQHLFEDLPPYVCTRDDCKTADQPYSRRRDWQRHETKMHNRRWACPFGCDDLFVSPDAFRDHITSSHSQQCELSALQSLSDSCVQTQDANETITHCVLCREQIVPSKRLFKHLGHHLEELALFSLPSRVFNDGSDDEAPDAAAQDLSAGTDEQSDAADFSGGENDVTHLGDDTEGPRAFEAQAPNQPARNISADGFDSALREERSEPEASIDPSFDPKDPTLTAAHGE